MRLTFADDDAAGGGAREVGGGVDHAGHHDFDDRGADRDGVAGHHEHATHARRQRCGNPGAAVGDDDTASNAHGGIAGSADDDGGQRRRGDGCFDDVGVGVGQSDRAAKSSEGSFGRRRGRRSG